MSKKNIDPYDGYNHQFDQHHQEPPGDWFLRHWICAFALILVSIPLIAITMAHEGCLENRCVGPAFALTVTKQGDL